jgi:hypothetical protein
MFSARVSSDFKLRSELREFEFRTVFLPFGIGAKTKVTTTKSTKSKTTTTKKITIKTTRKMKNATRLSGFHFFFVDFALKSPGCSIH